MSDKLKLINLVGARPQFIKASALSRVIRTQYNHAIDEVVVHSGQHYDEAMSDVFFTELEIPKPHYNLGVGSMSHAKQIAQIMVALEDVLLKEKPDLMVVYGDTNTTLAGALVASKMNIPIAHIEAGLRSWNNEMPEELNRRMTDHVSRWLFCPTKLSCDNLKNEGLQDLATEVGDVMMDVALYHGQSVNERHEVLSHLPVDSKYVLFTLHRNINTDNPDRLRSIIEGVVRLAEEFPVVFPMHPRTESLLPSDLYELLDSSECMIISPQPYKSTITLLSQASLIITDSGGLQKEGYFFKKPVVIPRNETEWEEAVELGCAFLVNDDADQLYTKGIELIQNPPSEFPEVYGDGKAAERIVERILKTLSK